MVYILSFPEHRPESLCSCACTVRAVQLRREVKTFELDEVTYIHG